MEKEPTETLKIRLSSGNTTADILNFLKKTTAKEVLFVCPRNYPVLAEVSVLKKIKSTAEKLEIKISFVTLQKWIRDIIHHQNLTVHPKCPQKFLELEAKTLDDFSGRIFAQKNIATGEISKSNKSKEKTPPPEFSMHRITEAEKSSRGTFFFVFLFLCLLLVGVLLWVSPRAEITIKPKISAVPITQNIIISLPDARIPEEEINLPKIQGIYVETEVAGTETFPSTERTYDLTNARGRVTLFNETDEPKFLIPSRLSTDDGIIFRTQKNITIPAKQGDQPGSIAVQVVADEYDSKGNPIGDRGNVEAGVEFFFPALRAASRDLYYAKANMGPMFGGSTLTHYFINSADFEAAAGILEDVFRTRAIEKLQAEMTARSVREEKKYVLLDRRELMKSELMDTFFPEDQVGQESQTFQVSAKLKLSGLVFDQAEVVKYLSDKVKATQDHRKKLIQMDKNSAQYRVMNADELAEKGWVKLSVSMFGTETLDFNSNRGFAKVWQKNLKKEIAGKPALEIKGILTNYPEIENILDIKIHPFWSETLPRIYDQITLKIVENY